MPQYGQIQAHQPTQYLYGQYGQPRTIKAATVIRPGESIFAIQVSRPPVAPSRVPIAIAGLSLMALGAFLLAVA